VIIVVPAGGSACAGGLDLSLLGREFPTVALEVRGSDPGQPAGGGALVNSRIDSRDWWAPDRLHSLDAAVEPARGAGHPVGPSTLCLRLVARCAEDALPLALQVLTRYQHLLDRRNRRSSRAVFDQVLVRHRHLHELSNPIIRADHRHALDTWQWALRLDPEASTAVQLAALFHDVERAILDPEVRSEPAGVHLQASRDAHARASARLTRLWLASLDLDREVLRVAERLIEQHERPADSPEQAVLNQADALSFLSRGHESYGLLGLADRVARALERLGPAAAAQLEQLRCAPAVEEQLARQLGARRAPPRCRRPEAGQPGAGRACEARLPERGVENAAPEGVSSPAATPTPALA